MDSFRSLLKKIRRHFQPKRAEDIFALEAMKLRAGDVAIDCGANVGDYTIVLAKTGATVFAFEPDPVAVQVLKDRLSSFPNVTVLNKAVSNVAGSVKLFLHKNREADPLLASTGSSLLASKTNVDIENYVEVEAVRFSDFIASIGSIRILKMDIEGHEIEVINDMIDSGTIHQVQAAFVELHDRKNPQLAESTDRLRQRIEATKVRFDLTWH
jgi:FkbM family methyltransferase